LIMELPQELAESILVKHWEKLKGIPSFFQAAIFVNTELTQKLAADAFEKFADRGEMLRYITLNFGMNTSGRSHRVTLEHFKALEPYLDHMDEGGLTLLWSACNRRKLFDWRREHLDHRVTHISDGGLKFDIASREAILDELCTRGHVWHNWVDRHFLELGYSLEEAFSTIADWAKKRGTEAAIDVAAELFFNEANRTHLPLFDRLVSGKANCAMLQSHVHFGVEYRSLL